MSDLFQVVPLHDNHYPENLKNIPDAPATLYIRGEFLRADQKAVAIVGSRNMSEYGAKIAKKFSSDLAKEGITIVSGLARGIDTIVHCAALNAGGRTIAVLGSGFHNFYPIENKELGERIEQSGAVVTEFEPDVKPWGKNFLIRNRIVSGLSLAVVVVEGRRRSGTLSTATHAANQGREVFAVPGPVDSSLSELPHYLIEQGARVAQSPRDLLEFIDEIK